MKLKVAPHISTLVPYPPGKPIEELEREYGISGSIKLASNENAWGPSPRAVAAIKDALQNLPDDPADQPNRDYIRWHREECFERI